MNSDRLFFVALRRSVSWVLEAIDHYMRSRGWSEPPIADVQTTHVAGWPFDHMGSKIRMVKPNGLGSETWTEGPHYSLN